MLAEREGWRDGGKEGQDRRKTHTCPPWVLSAQRQHYPHKSSSHTAYVKYVHLQWHSQPPWLLRAWDTVAFAPEMGGREGGRDKG